MLTLRANTKSFRIFCDCFLSKVIGSSKWKEECISKTVSEIATISDEAFTLLLLENHWDEWSNKNVEDYKKEAPYDAKNNKTVKRKPTKGKYTSEGIGAKLYGGWSNEGLLRFNALYDLVTENRKTYGDKVEKELLSHYVQDKGKKRKAIQVPYRGISLRCEDIPDV